MRKQCSLIRRILGSCLVMCSIASAETIDAGREFLKKHMPASDRQSLDQAVLENNLKYAYIARNEFPWAKQVPEEIFLNDVLPYALLDERRDDWRGDFYERFKKIVAPAKTQLEAIQLINKVINKELKVEYSTKRKKANQSPYESMEIGMASCTGLSILLADAFRSVGIPARVAGTPSWTTKRGNHNWVEIWLVSDQKWHFTEYYPDAKGIDHSWFTADAEKADPTKPEHRIYASSWKKSDQHFPMVWNWRSTEVPGVDVTARYLKDKKNEVVTGTEVRVEARSGDQRVATAVKIFSGENLLHEGVTPKPTDDANAYLTFHTEALGEVTIKWQNSAGEEQVKVVEFAQQKEPRLISIELK